MYDVLGNTYFCQEHIELSWHTACHGVYCKPDSDVVLVEYLHNFTDCILGLSHSKSLPWDDDDVLGVRHEFNHVFDVDFNVFPCDFCCLALA